MPPTNPTNRPTRAVKPPKKIPFRERKGQGITYAAAVTFLLTPFLLLLLGLIGSLIASALVIFYCVSDKKVHWALCILAAIVFLGIIGVQYNLLVQHK